MLTVIDYGAGNLGSIVNMIRKLGHDCKISYDIQTIKNATKIILPGVGHFDYGMNKLTDSGLIDLLNYKAIQEKIPILGICLGAQLMTKSSEEGKLPGLSWFDAKVIRFNFSSINQKLRIPHMGWNYVNIKTDTPLTLNMNEDTKFYFVHSYYIKSYIPEDIMLTSVYGNEFVAALRHNNLYAVQFHPEKSHKHGMNLLKNFLKL